jgi:phosphoenolpyruvate carboxylase
MAMQKNFFPLTAYLVDHPQYGEIWKMVVDEYELTEKYLFKLSGKTELMADYPVEKLSIQMRERIVLPLTTVQQYALMQLRENKMMVENNKEVLQKLIVRTSLGIINAGRNSV